MMNAKLAAGFLAWLALVRARVRVRVGVRVRVRVRARARVRARVRVRVRAPGAACRRVGWSGATARVGFPGYRRS